MTIRLSEYARARILTSGFRDTFNGGWIGVYSGVPPATPQGGLGAGVKLAEIRSSGGLNFSLVERYVIKHIPQTWTLQGINTGTAGWWRLHGPAIPDDPDGSDEGSNIYARMDGLCYSNTDPNFRVGMQLPPGVLSITPSTTRTIEQFLFTF